MLTVDYDRLRIGPGTKVDNLVRIGNAAADMLGSALVADTGEWGQFAWSDHVLGAPGYRLAGGTDEIQRNIIAERVLGLPADMRADRGMPFEKIPTGVKTKA